MRQFRPRHQLSDVAHGGGAAVTPPSNNTSRPPRRPSALAHPRGARGADPGPAGGFSEQELLARYLREAGQIPLLTPAAEAELFRTMEEGNPDERREARDAIITANLRLVIGVARGYIGLGLSLPELIAEGNLGLIAAVDRFERARGHRFSTFARWPIRKAITRAIDDRGRLVRLPANSWQTLRELRRAEQALPLTLGREPTSAELASACGVAAWRFDALRSAAQAPASLDAPAHPSSGAGADEDGALGDEIDGGEAPLPEIVARRIVHDQLGALLEGLSPRERALLVLRHGLDGTAPRTLQQVGTALGISGERTRQLEARALDQLRGNPLTAALHDSLD